MFVPMNAQLRHLSVDSHHQKIPFLSSYLISPECIYRRNACVDLRVSKITYSFLSY